ncbi:MAG: hypothetical protein IIT98_00370, partial [Kiritimatiellae bacterium]|nr:hypothetical protein [Kiritimatiellia bacterium]
TPFIPGKADDSGIPGAVFRYEVENLSGEEAEVLVVSSMGNIHNLHGMDWFDNVLQTRNGLHEARQEKGLTGVFMTGDDAAEDSLTFANNAIAALDVDVYAGLLFGLVCERQRHDGEDRDGPDRENERAGASGACLRQSGPPPGAGGGAPPPPGGGASPPPPGPPHGCRVPPPPAPRPPAAPPRRRERPDCSSSFFSSSGSFAPSCDCSYTGILTILISGAVFVL